MTMWLMINIHSHTMLQTRGSCRKTLHTRNVWLYLLSGMVGRTFHKDKTGQGSHTGIVH